MTGNQITRRRYPSEYPETRMVKSRQLIPIGINCIPVCIPFCIIRDLTFLFQCKTQFDVSGTSKSTLLYKYYKKFSYIIFNDSKVLDKDCRWSHIHYVVSPLPLDYYITLICSNTTATKLLPTHYVEVHFESLNPDGLLSQRPSSFVE